MADELKITIAATYINGTLRDTIAPGQIEIDAATNELWRGTMNVGTSDETISPLDITTMGYWYVRNLDPTNYIEIGPNSDGNVLEPFIKLLAGENAIFPVVPGLTIKAKANTAAVDLEIRVYGR